MSGMQVRTRSGIFGPGGYGGGVFDGSNMGFGGMGDYEQAAAGIGDIVWRGTTPDPQIKAMQVALNTELKARGFVTLTADGILGANTCGAIAWLGTLKDVNFDANPDLHLIELIVQPDSSGTLTNICQTSTYPTKVSGGVFKPPDSFSNQLPWGADNATTLKVQHDLNNDLDGHGYIQIAETSKLDADTCGAMQLAENSWGMQYLSEYGKNCQSFNPPARKAAPPPPTPAPAPPADTTHLPAPQKSSMTGWVVGGLVAAAVVAGVVASKKRKH